jgi:uncharacterized protein YidB (DUF937 family)
VIESFLEDILQPEKLSQLKQASGLSFEQVQSALQKLAPHIENGVKEQLSASDPSELISSLMGSFLGGAEQNDTSKGMEVKILSSLQPSMNQLASELGVSSDALSRLLSAVLPMIVATAGSMFAGAFSNKAL